MGGVPGVDGGREGVAGLDSGGEGVSDLYGGEEGVAGVDGGGGGGVPGIFYPEDGCLVDGSKVTWYC